MTELAGPADRARYLTIAEAADYLNVTERFMRRVVAERRIRHYRVGKFLRFDPADLDGFARMGEVAVGESGRATEVWLSARRLG